MPMALKLHNYRLKVRPKALTISLRKAKNLHEAETIKKNSVHLFLNPNNGNRYTGQQIYDFWTNEKVNRIRGWSPHLARDFWACSVLWKHLEQQQALFDQAIKNKAEPAVLKLLTLESEGFIQLTIQRQLRHGSRETTMIYLQWVSDRLGVNMNFHDNYVQQLSDEQMSEESE